MEPSDAEAATLTTLDKLLEWATITGSFREALLEHLGILDLIRDSAAADKDTWCNVIAAFKISA